MAQFKNRILCGKDIVLVYYHISVDSSMSTILQPQV